MGKKFGWENGNPNNNAALTPFPRCFYFMVTKVRSVMEREKVIREKVMNMRLCIFGQICKAAAKSFKKTHYCVF